MKEISKNVPGKDIKLTKNCPPIPDVAKIVFSEAGEILHIIFCYCNSKQADGKKLLEWLEQYAEAVTGRPLPPMEVLYFDGEFEIEGKILRVSKMTQSLKPNSVRFFWPTEDESAVVVEFDVDFKYFYWVE